MIMASWNIRGVNDPFKQRELCSLVLKNKICLLGLNETKVREENSKRISDALMQGWRARHNYQQHQNGRIWVLWNPDIVDVSILHMSEQVIHTKVTVTQKQVSFFASFVYGLHSRREQGELWQQLQCFSTQAMASPWITLGDFNVVRRPEERLGGNLHWSVACEDLQKCCQALQLEDLHYTGHFLTWSKGSGDNFLSRKLDRVLVNHIWLQEFEGAEACFLPPGSSDHSPMTVKLGISLHIRRPPFKFFDFWTSSPLYFDIVSQVWST